mmetsp:Transcript_126266/g.218773  ORF Transcript_126266/g.218773 Transcript_126266/m.218773 type:complete len:99 (-) Transcript_126266:600-896(-)
MIALWGAWTDWQAEGATHGPSPLACLGRLSKTRDNYRGTLLYWRLRDTDPCTRVPAARYIWEQQQLQLRACLQNAQPHPSTLFVFQQTSRETKKKSLP